METPSAVAAPRLVLIVEDDMDIALLESRWLKSAFTPEPEAMIVTSLGDAIEWLSDAFTHIDLVVLDLLLPDSPTAPETLHAITPHTVPFLTPIMLVTAMQEGDIRQEFMTNAPYAFLSKDGLAQETFQQQLRQVWSQAQVVRQALATVQTLGSVLPSASGG